MRLAAPLSRRRWKRMVALAVLIFSLCLVVDFYGYPYGAPPPGVSGNRGANGLWLRHTWYFGRHTDAEVRALADRLRDAQVRDAYFHVRFVERSGRLHFRYGREARRLTDTLRRTDPGLRRVAWVYTGNFRGAGNVDLNDPGVRRRMAEEARWLTTECGFDGIQWDYEICADGEPGLLELLRETRTAMPPGKFLGVATALEGPWPLRAVGHGWSARYFGEVAALSDQIAVMGYDSGLYLPRAYAELMRAQTRNVTRAARAANPRCGVLIGVPTYGKGGASHHWRTENVYVALRGVRQGIADLTPEERQSLTGVALFADYTTEPAEWEAYRRLWLER